MEDTGIGSDAADCEGGSYVTGMMRWSSEIACSFLEEALRPSDGGSCLTGVTRREVSKTEASHWAPQADRIPSRRGRSQVPSPSAEESTEHATRPKRGPTVEREGNEERSAQGRRRQKAKKGE